MIILNPLNIFPFRPAIGILLLVTTTLSILFGTPYVYAEATDVQIGQTAQTDTSDSKSIKSYLSTLDGFTTLRYKLQNLESSRSDQDFSQYISLSLGDSAKDRITWYFSGSFREDIDDSANKLTKEKRRRLIFPRTPIERDRIVSNNPFFSIDDSIKDGFTVRPYEFYADVNGFSFLKNVRAGRQYIREVENLHFDGLKLDFADYKGFRLTTFAGKPVHFFEESSSGDFLAGASLEFQPIKGSRLKLNYTFVNDNNSEIEENDDNLFTVSLRQNIKEWWNVFLDLSVIDQTSRDVEIRSNWIFSSLNLDVNVSIFKQLSELNDYTTEFDDFNIITGDYAPYTEYSIDLYKGFRENFGINAGFNIRKLNEDSDEGPFNHEFRRFFGTISARDLLFKGSSLSLTGSYYNTEDDDIWTLGFDYRQKIGSKLTVVSGSYFSLFKFDAFSRFTKEPVSPILYERASPLFRPNAFDDFERNNVRTFFLNLTYDFTDRVEMSTDYEFESNDQERYHTIEASLQYKF